jgi:hypothetical protein
MLYTREEGAAFLALGMSASIGQKDVLETAERVGFSSFHISWILDVCTRRERTRNIIVLPFRRGRWYLLPPLHENALMLTPSSLVLYDAR